MRNLFFFSILIISISCFTIQSSQKFPQQNNIIKACSSDQITMVYNAIGSCQQQIIIKTLACMAVFIVQSNQTQWDIFIKQSNSSDAVVYWPNTCTIQLNNYGKFNRQYKLWTAFVASPPQNSPQRINMIGNQSETNQVLSKLDRQIQNAQQTIASEKKDQLPNQQIIKASGCTERDHLHIKTALKDCDKPSNADAALCMVNKLKQSLGDKWDAYYSTGGSQIAFWYSLTKCSAQYDNYGQYKRRIQVWQAQ